MSEFVVESYFSGEPANVTPRVGELALAAPRLSEDRVRVRFVCATFLLEEEEICLYESASADAVREAVTRAGLRFERITGAVSLRPRDRLGSDAHKSARLQEGIEEKGVEP